MDSILEHAYVIPLIPAASFVIILLFGKRLKYKGAEVGIAALAICFLLAVGANVQWRSHVNDAESKEKTAHEEVADAEPAPVAESTGEAHAEEFHVEPFQKSWTWWQSGGVTFTVGMLLDGMSVMMLFVVTLI